MSKLAEKLATVAEAAKPVKRGPDNKCFPIYGAGDLEDWEAIARLRSQGHTWRDTQRIVDSELGITTPLVNDKFRYHWGRKCFCWPEELRLR